MGLGSQKLARWDQQSPRSGERECRPKSDSATEIPSPLEAYPLLAMTAFTRGSCDRLHGRVGEEDQGDPAPECEDESAHANHSMPGWIAPWRSCGEQSMSIWRSGLSPIPACLGAPREHRAPGESLERPRGSETTLIQSYLRRTGATPSQKSPFDVHEQFICGH